MRTAAVCMTCRVRHAAGRDERYKKSNRPSRRLQKQLSDQARHPVSDRVSTGTCEGTTYKTGVAMEHQLRTSGNGHAGLSSTRSNCRTCNKLPHYLAV